jgi:hypothetical protein
MRVSERGTRTFSEPEVGVSGEPPQDHRGFDDGFLEGHHTKRVIIRNAG